VDPLTLPEQLILLYFDGAVPQQPHRFLEQGVVGAQLAELDTLGRLVGVGRKRLGVVDAGPTGDDLLDALLQDIIQGNGKTLHWRDTQQYPAYLHRLVGRGLLEEVEQRTLRVFRSRLYRTCDSASVAAIRSGIDAVVVGGATPERPGSLGTLMWAIAHDYGLYPGRQGRPYRKRLKLLARDDWIAQTVRKAVLANHDR
jgi:Golgi phosphoprotein 3 (GPP34)